MDLTNLTRERMARAVREFERDLRALRARRSALFVERRRVADHERAQRVRQRIERL